MAVPQRWNVNPIGLASATHSYRLCCLLTICMYSKSYWKAVCCHSCVADIEKHTSENGRKTKRANSAKNLWLQHPPLPLRQITCQVLRSAESQESFFFSSFPVVPVQVIMTLHKFVYELFKIAESLNRWEMHFGKRRKVVTPSTSPMTLNLKCCKWHAKITPISCWYYYYYYY